MTVTPHHIVFVLTPHTPALRAALGQSTEVSNVGPEHNGTINMMYASDAVETGVVGQMEALCRVGQETIGVRTTGFQQEQMYFSFVERMARCCGKLLFRYHILQYIR